MTATDLAPRARPLPLALLRLGSNLIIGGLLCTTPLTALVVLGWLTRRMDRTAWQVWGSDRPDPGWLLGPRGQGWITRCVGGLAANFRIGVVTFTGLALWTLPFTLLWLGAWWAGWENSFNKGYEQAAIGPTVWLAGALLAIILLAHLPFALAHAAVEMRLAAFFEGRRIRSVTAAAGWRGAGLALLSVALSLPLLGVRAAPPFIESIVPGFADMPPDRQGDIVGTLTLLTAFYTFAMLWLLRHRAAAIYARAVIRAAAGRNAALWAGHIAAARIAPPPPTRLEAALWPVMSSLIWLALVVQIVLGQFINYAPLRWLTQPVFLLPWAG